MIKKFKRNQKGIAVIEFAMLFLPFFLFVAAIIEGLVLVYKISIVDYLTDNIAKKVVTFKQGYAERFNTELAKSGSDLYVNFNENNTLVNISYCNSLQEILEDSCSGNELSFKVAVFSVVYKLDPMILGLRLVPGFETVNATAIYPKEGDLLDETNQAVPKK